MRVFIDESGSFSWQRPGWSIVASVGVCELDGTLEAMIERFRTFERSLPPVRRSSSGEIKGSVLTDQELARFVWEVLPRSRDLAHVSLVGFDSRETSRETATRFREVLASDGTRRARHRYASKGDQPMVQLMDETAAWIRRRSPEDLGWLVATQVAIADALVHSVAVLQDDQHNDGRELAALSYVLDRSSRVQGKRKEHIWSKVLNSLLCARSAEDPFPHPNHWPAEHAFVAKYSRANGFDFSELWRGMTFANSQETPGLRIADLVAQVTVRHFARDEAQSAWKRLRPIVVGGNESELHAVVLALPQEAGQRSAVPRLPA